MAKSIGQNFNKTDTATIDVVSVGSILSTTLVAEQTNGDMPYFSIWIYNSGNQELWIKFQAASVDNDKKGILLMPGETRCILEFPRNYTGEISGIMDSGAARDVHVTVY